MTVVCVGLATLDTILAVPRHPDADDRVVATELVVAGGGPAATAAVTLARCREAAWVHVDHVGYGAVPRDVHLSIDGGNPIAGLDLGGIALYAPTERALREAFGTPERALAAGAALVVVTRGARGCAAYTPDGEVVEAPGHTVDPVSTLGAGDVFHGALLAQLVRNVPLAEALRTANACAALSCRALDGRSAIPTAQELVA